MSTLVEGSVDFDYESIDFDYDRLDAEEIIENMPPVLQEYFKEKNKEGNSGCPDSSYCYYL